MTDEFEKFPSQKDVIKFIDQLEKDGLMTPLEAEYYRDAILPKFKDKPEIFYLFLELYSMISSLRKEFDNLRTEVVINLLQKEMEDEE